MLPAAICRFRKAFCEQLDARYDAVNFIDYPCVKYRNTWYRYYHNLDHVASMLEMFEKNERKSRNPIAVKMAILWHDVFYHPLRNDNEIMSALLFDECTGCHEKRNILFENVPRMIMVTTHNRNYAPTNYDEGMIADLDLAGLASDPAIYRRNTENIKREYLEAGCSEKDWNDGRKLFLLQMLAKAARNSGSIYYLPTHRNEWSGIFDHNLKEELRAFGMKNEDIVQAVGVAKKQLYAPFSHT